jgi:hypothetical protein
MHDKIKIRLLAGLLCATSVIASASELGTITLSNGTLSWTNSPDTIYEIQWKPRLTETNWNTQWPSSPHVTGEILQVDMPHFFRISAQTYPEQTNSAECYAMYSNALLDAKSALITEISTDLLPLIQEAEGTQWRTFTNWVDGSTSQWVKVSTMQGEDSWKWSTLLQPGPVTLTNGYSSEIWVTPFPELHDLCKNYSGSNQRLRMQKALGLPPKDGEFGIIEFFIDPKYIFRPTPDCEVNDTSAGLAVSNTTHHLAPNSLHGISEGYAQWFQDNYTYSGYEATNDLNHCWPWTRLGYTYDYANVPTSPFGLSEYVIPDASQESLWGTGLTIPIYVEARYSAETYGKE